VFHTPLVIFTQTPILSALGGAISDRGLVLAIFAIILGLLAGLFEEIGRYLVFRRFFPSRNITLTRENGLLFGAGWGGVESMLVGFLVFLTLVSYVSTPFLPGSPLQNLTPLDPLIGLLERLMTFPIQIAFSLLVASAVLQGRLVFLGLAILWHTAVDALAVYLVATTSVAITEGSVAVSAVIALVYIWYMWPGSGRAKSGEL